MKQFLSAADVAKLCDVSSSKAYSIIAELNAELKAKGYLTKTSHSKNGLRTLKTQ